MLGGFFNKVTSFVKRFNEPLDDKWDDIDDYLSGKGINYKRKGSETADTNASDNKELYEEELSYERNNCYVFHIFRVCFSERTMSNVRESLSYIKTCDINGLDSFFSNIGVKDLVSRKTRLKWRYDYNPVYYLDYLNKPDSTVISVDKRTFRVTPVDDVFSIGMRISRVSVNDNETVLSQLPESVSNDTDSNAFLVFASKGWKSLGVKMDILRKELERVGITAEIASFPRVDGNGDIVDLLREDKIKESPIGGDQAIISKRDKKIIEIELLILEKILRNEKSSIARN